MAAAPDHIGIVGYPGDRRFELLVDAVTDYAIYLLDKDGYVASWNRGAQRFKYFSNQATARSSASIWFSRLKKPWPSPG